MRLRKYVLVRFGQMLLLAVVVSILSFLIIKLPPGDYLTVLKSQLQMEYMDEATIQRTLAAINERFSLDEPGYIQYFRWITGILKGDFGYSFALREKVGTLIGERIGLTIFISFCAMLFTWLIAIPIGVYSSIRQYSVGDSFFTFIGFIGLATPNFLLALIIMYLAVTVFGASGIGGLFSREYAVSPWSLAKFVDLMKHLWLPVVIVGTAGTAEMTRVIRAKMLDVVGEPYIVTARMKGISEKKVILKHALRVAFNPVISRAGMSLRDIISGEIITAVVLALPTIGPLLLRSLLAEDMYLACTILLILAMALVVGNFLADLLLAWLDPRIRFD